jgi:hypothetical protein
MQPNKSSISRYLNDGIPGFEENFADQLSACAEIVFGTVKLSEEEKVFCRQLNREILLLCKSLPQSTQIDALSFLFGYAGTSFNQEINFFKNYYVPAWSVIYWMVDSCPENKKPADRDLKYAARAHSMAMFLHSLDDHLNDGQLSVTHLSLLLRSQAWMRMRNSLEDLCAEVSGGQDIVKNFIDDYYFSVCNSQEIESLDGYCDFFRKQMATWLVVPTLLAKKIAGNDRFILAIQRAYESFGIAWRLLDDIQDIEKDMIEGTHSAIYYCLSEDLKHMWDKQTGRKLDSSNEYAKAIGEFVLKTGSINRIKERICRELESAGAIADRLNMPGLKNEFISLLQPIKNKPDST